MSLVTYVPLFKHSGRVLVTGAAGFIGEALCKELKSRGYFVIGADIQPLSLPEACDEFHHVDLRDKRVCMEACRGCETVFHLAADMGMLAILLIGCEVHLALNDCEDP
jgi:nucleoside-diphosphate-sugar epimerase